MRNYKSETINKLAEGTRAFNPVVSLDSSPKVTWDIADVKLARFIASLRAHAKSPANFRHLLLMVFPQSDLIRCAWLAGNIDRLSDAVLAAYAMDASVATTKQYTRCFYH